MIRPSAAPRPRVICLACRARFVQKFPAHFLCGRCWRERQAMLYLEEAARLLREAGAIRDGAE